MAQRHSLAESATSFRGLRWSNFAGLQLGCQRRAVRLHLLLGALQIREPGLAIPGRRKLLNTLDGQRRRDDVRADHIGGEQAAGRAQDEKG